MRRQAPTGKKPLLIGFKPSFPLSVLSLLPLSAHHFQLSLPFTRHLSLADSQLLLIAHLSSPQFSKNPTEFIRPPQPTSPKVTTCKPTLLNQLGDHTSMGSFVLPVLTYDKYQSTVDHLEFATWLRQYCNGYPRR